MWKPTKEGIYMHGGEYSRVMYPNTIAIWNEPTPRYCPDDFDPVATCPDDWRRWQGRLTPVPDGPWSLLAPDWQPGAPTLGQLAKWRWWALSMVTRVGKSPFITAGAVGTGIDDIISMGVVWSKDEVIRSTPIQPDLSNGPLWVPLEVAK